MTTDRKISPQQLFCILLLSELTAEAVYPQSSSVFGGEAVLAVLMAEIIRFVLALPVIIYSFNGTAFYAASYRKNKFFGWVCAIGAAILLIGAACRTLLYSAEFTQQCIITGTSAAVIFIVSAAFAIYSAYMGVEAQARAGVLLLAAAGIITVIIVIADIPYMEFPKMHPMQSDFGDLFRDTLSRVLHGGDYLIFAALLPFVRTDGGSAGKTALFFSLFSTLGALFLCSFGMMTLRELYSHTVYPFAAAATLSDISLFKRLDGIGCAVWSVCAALRAGVMLFSAYSVIMEIPACMKASNGRKEAGV